MRKVRTRHETHYTVLPNALAQHGTLSLRARGLALLILSLPDGADVSIRGLMDVLPDGQAAIAAALRELEAAGYLTRTVARADGGRLVTRTVVRDVPGAIEPDPAPEPEPESAPVDAAPAEPEPERHEPDGDAPAAAPAHCPVPTGDGAQLLIGIAAREPRLTIGAAALPELAALADQALHVASAGQITAALTTGLPSEVRSAAALIRHRLGDRLPVWEASARVHALQHAHAHDGGPDEDPAAPAKPRYVECRDCRAPMRTATPDGLCSTCRH